MARSLADGAAQQEEPRKDPARLRSQAALYRAVSVLCKRLNRPRDGIDPDRYFCGAPIVDPEADETYVISNQWGPSTEPTLSKLADAFPAANVSFRRADPEDE